MFSVLYKFSVIKALGLFSRLYIQINIKRGAIMKEFIKKLLALFQPAQLPPPAQYVEEKVVIEEPKAQVQEKQKPKRRPKKTASNRPAVVANPTMKKVTKSDQRPQNKPRKKQKPNNE